MTEQSSPKPTTLYGLLEALGIMIIILGAGLVVGAVSLVSTTLAILTSGVFLIFGGVVAVFAAARLEALAASSDSKPGGTR